MSIYGRLPVCDAISISHSFVITLIVLSFLDTVPILEKETTSVLQWIWTEFFIWYFSINKSTLYHFHYL